MSGLTPEQRSLRARAAAHAMHAAHDARETTAAARAALWERYRDRVDPERRLDPAERDRRAKSLMKADLARHALKAARERTRCAEAALADQLLGVGA